MTNAAQLIKVSAKHDIITRAPRSRELAEQVNAKATGTLVDADADEAHFWGHTKAGRPWYVVLTSPVVA